MTILIKNRQRLKRLNRKKIKKTALKILSILEKPAAELSILFVDDKQMRQLNTAFRGIRRTTDVLSFPQTAPGEGNKIRNPKPAYRQAGPKPAKLTGGQTRSCILGDIVISTQRAVLQAKNSGTGFYDEIFRLLTHGVLHLLGYDHEKTQYKAKAMLKKEQEILNAVKKMG